MLASMALKLVKKVEKSFTVAPTSLAPHISRMECMLREGYRDWLRSETKTRHKMDER